MRVWSLITFIGLVQIADSFRGNVSCRIRADIRRKAQEQIVAAVSIFEPQLTAKDSVVFFVSALPFGWATIEFWRRIAKGERFGTGSDSILIGDDLDPASSRGQRSLGKVSS